MKKTGTLGIFVMISAMLIAFPALSDLRSVKKREGGAHQHYFHSEQLENTSNLIVYVVCNQTDSESDFFWSKAGFGVGEDEPVPAHRCVHRKDYIATADESARPRPGEGSSQVYVKHKGGEVPTLFWCDYQTLDRCGNDLTSGVVSWISGLRMFGTGPSDEPTEPLVEIGVELTGGRYDIEIQYSAAAGRLIVIARNSSLDTAVFQDRDNKDIGAKPLKEEIDLGDPSINADFEENLPTIEVPPLGQTGGRFSFYFTDTEKVTSLSVVSKVDREIGFRLDSVPLMQTAN